MKTNAKKFENILKIFDMLVESRNYVTSKTFAEKLNVTERTVFRYIQEIALAFSPYEPIEASYEGYRLFKHDFIDLLNNRDDYFTIASININTFGKLLNKKIKFPEEFLKKIMERIELKSNIPESILRPLLKAIMEGRICEIQYQQIDKILNTSVVLLKLVSKDSIFYLNIYDTSDDKCKLIAVDKIKEINLTTG